MKLILTHTENANIFWVQFIKPVFVKTQGKTFVTQNTTKVVFFFFSSCKAKKENKSGFSIISDTQHTILGITTSKCWEIRIFLPFPIVFQQGLLSDHSSVFRNCIVTVNFLFKKLNNINLHKTTTQNLDVAVYLG